MGAEVGTTFMQQPMDPFCIKLRGLVLKPRHHRDSYIFVLPEYTG
jgi:hypothetical protein